MVSRWISFEMVPFQGNIRSFSEGVGFLRENIDKVQDAGMIIPNTLVMASVFTN